MKKKVLLVMGLCVMLLAGGCSKNGAAGDLSSDSSTTEDTTDTTDATVTGVPEKEAYVASDYIKLGNYKGVKVTVTKLTVTDADVEAAIQSDLDASTTTEEITDRKDVKDGDIVNIDYEGLKDGVAFDGGTGTDYDLTIGSGTFIDGFESGLIGKKVGEKVELKLTFPEDYSSADLAGQDVVFNVTINAIKKTVVPELTEDYVKENTDYDSIAAYKKAKLESLKADNEETLNSNISNEVITAIIDDSKIDSYPQTLTDYYSASYENYVTQMLYYQYGMAIADYLSATGSTQEEFDANVKEVAQNYASLELVERAIAETEKMSISDDDYKNELTAYMTDYGVTTEDELLKYMTKDEIKDDMLLKKALNLAVDNAVVTKVDPTPTPAPTATPAK